MLVGDDLFVIPRQVMRLEHGLGDLRNGEGLEDAPIGTEPEPGHGRLDDSLVTGASEAGFPLSEGGNDAGAVPDGMVGAPDRKRRRLVQYLAEGDGRMGAGQIQIKAEGLAERFLEVEFHDLKVMTAVDRKGETQFGFPRHADALPAAPG